jgi:hypothetical protein
MHHTIKQYHSEDQIPILNLNTLQDVKTPEDQIPILNLNKLQDVTTPEDQILNLNTLQDVKTPEDQIPILNLNKLQDVTTPEDQIPILNLNTLQDVKTPEDQIPILNLSTLQDVTPLLDDNIIPELSLSKVRKNSLIALSDIKKSVTFFDSILPRNLNIAYGLYGHFSKTYMKNNVNGDYFFFSFPTNCELSNFEQKPEQWKIHDIPFDNVMLLNLESYTENFMKNKVTKMINDSTIKYDIIIISRFEDLFQKGYPEVPGTYDLTNSSIRIISDQAIKIGYKIHFLRSLNNNMINGLFLSLFDGRVYTPSSFSQINEISDRYNRANKIRQLVDNEEIKIIDLTYTEKMEHIYNGETYGKVFMIPSVINISDNPIAITNHRSIYTPDERLQQTVEQCISIRKHTGPNDRIFILEGSFLNLYQIKKLQNVCDNLILFAYDTEANKYANISTNKSIYEVYVLEFMLRRITEFTHFFKFGGRYSLTSKCNLKKFIINRPIFREIPAEVTWSKKSIMCTVLYSFPKLYQVKYLKIYNMMLNEMIPNMDKLLAVENMIHDYTDDFVNCPQLEITGSDATNAVWKVI